MHVYIIIFDLSLAIVVLYTMYYCYHAFRHDIQFISMKLNIIEMHVSQIVNTEIKMKNSLCTLSENCIHLPHNFVSLPFYTKRRILLTFPALDGLYIRPHPDPGGARYRISSTGSM